MSLAVPRTATGTNLESVSERHDWEPAEAWLPVDYDAPWSAFELRFGFRASTTPAGWPAIREPSESVTFDLSRISDGAERGAAYDCINAEALRAFVCALPTDDLVVLDWQHQTYRFRPTVQALTWRPEWAVPVYPDGDYYAFFTDDFSEGTFGHPWEQTLCVVGDRLMGSLGRTLATWLPVKRCGGSTYLG